MTVLPKMAALGMAVEETRRRLAGIELERPGYFGKGDGVDLRLDRLRHRSGDGYRSRGRDERAIRNSTAPVGFVVNCTVRATYNGATGSATSTVNP